MATEVYITTNTRNNKYYIGVHERNDANKGYLGSGVALGHSIKKHGKDCFNKEVISLFESSDLAYFLEKVIVGDDVVEDRESYNITIGGGNPPTFFGSDHPTSVLSDDDRKTVKTIYNNGISMSEIAGIFNTSKAVISNNLKKMGVKTRAKSDYESNKLEAHHAWIDKDEKEICDLYLSGKSSIFISNLYGCTYGVITNVLKRNNVKIRGAKDYISKKTSQYNKNGDFIKTYKSSKEASRLTGVCYSYIVKVINKPNRTAGGFIWRTA